MLSFEVIITLVCLFIALIYILLRQNKYKAVKILCFIILIPIIICEFLVLFWFWGGDGKFNFFVVPIVFLFYLFLHIVLIKKYKQLRVPTLVLKISIFILITPLTLSTVWLVSRIFGIDINIQ